MSQNQRSFPLTIEAAGKMYAPHLTSSAIRRLVRSGEIPHKRIGSKYLVTVEAIETWLKGNQSTQLEETSQ